MAERRKHQRVPLAFPIRLRIGNINEFTEQYSSDLSSGGIFVKMNYPPPVGTDVDVEFYLEPVQKTIKTRGRVARAIPEGNPDGETPGMGVQFTDMGKEAARFIELVVQKYNRSHPSQFIELPEGFLEEVDKEAASPGGKHPGATELKIRIKLPDASRFVKDFSESLQRSRMFIPTKTPRPVGTRVHLQILLEKENQWLSADGEVVEPASAGEKAHAAKGLGMTVRVSKESTEFKQVLSSAARSAATT